MRAMPNASRCSSIQAYLIATPSRNTPPLFLRSPGPAWRRSEPHTHPHRHLPITHEDAHYPDIHHRHNHGPKVKDPKRTGMTRFIAFIAACAVVGAGWIALHL